MLEPDKRKELAKDLDALATKYGLDYEELLLEQAQLMREDMERQKHDTVKSLLESAATHIEIASFEFYASFK